MEVKSKEITDYLEDVHSGKFKEGLKLGCTMDDYMRYKQGTFNMILGFDNVGKTYWRTWYYLCIAVLHKKTFAVWSGENKAGSIVKNLAQMLAGKSFKDFTKADIHRYSQEVSQYIKFVDNKHTYSFKDLLNVFEDLDADCGLIDPLTGIKRKFGHEANYELLNDGREWVNKTGKSLELCLHPTSEASRTRFFPADHDWKGQIREPSKTFAEGGQPFASRCDDYYIVHRLPKLASMKYFTMIHVDKVKETETGGEQTEADVPQMLYFNNGLGFTIGGINPLKAEQMSQVKPLPSPIKQPKPSDIEDDLLTYNENF